jgi:hypothetical protein
MSTARRSAQLLLATRRHLSVRTSLPRGFPTSFYTALQVQPCFFSSVPMPQAEEMRSFQDLDNLNPKTLNALEKQGIETMTEIQTRTWEAVSQGKDVLGRSRTGSGKVSSLVTVI